MEDASLDDFFAKKDKTKKKNKSKLTPSDILAQQETGSKKSKKKKDKENEATSEEQKIPNVILAEDDENWVDFEQEAEADYSGLRIQNLQIINKEEEEEEEESNENEEDEGEQRQRKDEVSGPWNKSTQPPQSAPTTVPEPPAPEPEVPKEEEPKPRKYVPPGARASSTPAMTPTKLTARKKKTAPNLQSEDDFPTLGGGGVVEMRSWGSNSENTEDFEKVQSGGRSMEDPNKVNQQLTLGNRYSSLQD